MIDMSHMCDVRVDPERRRAWVEGGATWGDVDAATQVHGLATPGGLISDTGVGGLTLSGGIGWLRSRYGLCIDNLVSADVVTADGRLVHAGPDEHADLLWALKGGGGNFGVVTGFEFALHPVGPRVMFAGPVYPVDAGSGPIRFWRDFLADKHDRVGSLVEFSTIPSDPEYPRGRLGQARVHHRGRVRGRRGRRRVAAPAVARAGRDGDRLLGPDGLQRAPAAVRHRHPVRPAPELLEEPLPRRPVRRGHRPGGRAERAATFAQHPVIDLELRRCHSGRRRRRHGLWRSVDALDGVHRFDLGRAGGRHDQHRLDARLLGSS